MDNRVIVVDLDIPFGKMVWFMVKWTLASIPAMILVSLILFAIFVLLGACGVTAIDQWFW